MGWRGFWEKRGALGRDQKHRCTNKMHLFLDAKEITSQSREEMRKSGIWRSQHHWLKGHESECVLQSMGSWRVGADRRNLERGNWQEHPKNLCQKVPWGKELTVNSEQHSLMYHPRHSIHSTIKSKSQFWSHSAEGETDARRLWEGLRAPVGTGVWWVLPRKKWSTPGS